MRFIGHLDFMRFFQKVIRRAGLDIRFSEGISPHMVMSFASPLGVGMTSEGDYVDIELNTPVSTETALRALNENSVPDVRFTDFIQVEEGKAGKAMALVAAADYLIGFREGCAPAEDWTSDLPAFLEQKEIIVTRRKKKAVKKADGKKKRHQKDGGDKESGEAPGLEENVTETLDIRPLIYQARPVRSGNRPMLQMRLSSGSAANLRPELVMEAFAAFAGRSFDAFTLQIHRLDLLARAENGGTGEIRFVPLSALGKPAEGADTQKAAGVN